MKAWRRPGGGVTFTRSKGWEDLPQVEIPCGQCIGCRLSRSKQWATRIMHEAQMHEHNHFLTLTYSDEHLPADYSVDVREFQLFMKRLRFQKGNGIRFFHCGEYGSKTFRPHYHAILFGCDISDLKRHKQNSQGDYLYRSEEIEKLWTKGHVLIGAVTTQSAAYVARYVLKKIGGKAAENHYRRIHPYTGEEVQVKPEYCTMSRRPGIGAAWYEKYKSDAYPSDFVVLEGHKVAVPKYYDRQLEKEDQETLEDMKMYRRVKARRHKKDQTPERLEVREKVQLARISHLKRELD